MEGLVEYPILEVELNGRNGPPDRGSRRKVKKTIKDKPFGRVEKTKVKRYKKYMVITQIKNGLLPSNIPREYFRYARLFSALELKRLKLGDTTKDRGVREKLEKLFRGLVDDGTIDEGGSDEIEEIGEEDEEEEIGEEDEEEEDEEGMVPEHVIKDYVRASAKEKDDEWYNTSRCIRCGADTGYSRNRFCGGDVCEREEYMEYLENTYGKL